MTDEKYLKLDSNTKFFKVMLSPTGKMSISKVDKSHLDKSWISRGWLNKSIFGSHEGDGMYCTEDFLNKAKKQIIKKSILDSEGIVKRAIKKRDKLKKLQENI